MVDLDFLDQYEDKIARSKEKIDKFWSSEVRKQVPTSVWVPSYYSLEKGMLCRLSEDNLISISEDMYQEFLLPYNELIFREVGGD